MVDEGTIIGSTKSSVGTRPGEKVISYYHGNVQNGFQLVTYLSSVTTYLTDTRHRAAAASASPYITSIYEVQGQDGYRRLYMSVYSVGTGELAAGGVDVSVLIVGER